MSSIRLDDAYHARTAQSASFLTPFGPRDPASRRGETAPGPYTSPALPLRRILQSAGVSTQGAPPLRCGVRREGGLRADGGSKSQPAVAPAVAVTVAYVSEAVQRVVLDEARDEAEASLVGRHPARGAS
jgi:hypothetical protein